MTADYELVFNKEECVNKGDMRGKKRIARVEGIVKAYEKWLKSGAEGVMIAMADDKERANWHTFRYRLNSAADALGIKVKVSIRQEEELAVVTLTEGKEDAIAQNQGVLDWETASEFELHVRLTESKEQPMGTMIDATRLDGLGEEGAKRAREAGENAYWVNPGRPGELSREGLLRTTYQEYQMHRHGGLDRVSIKEREIGGVLDLLKRNDSMTTGEALEALRSDAGEARGVD